MSEKTKAALNSDLKRITPILGIVLVTALAVTISMRLVAHNHLHAAIAASPNACSYAEMFFNAGYKRMNVIRQKTGEKRLTEAEGVFKADALGILKGDEDVAKARADFLRSYELCPSNSNADYNLAIVEWYAGNAAASHFYLGTHASKAKKTEEAAIQFQLSLEQDSSFGPAILHLALANQQLGRMDRALVLVAEREDELANVPDGKSILGRIYGRQAGERDKAIQLLKEALLENPVDTFAIAELARLIREEDRLREGADFFMSLADRGDRNIFISFSFAAEFYRILGELTLEEAALRQALRLFSNSPDLNYHISVNLWKQKKTAESRDYIRLAMEHNYSRVMQLIEQTGNDPRK